MDINKIFIIFKTVSVSLFLILPHPIIRFVSTKLSNSLKFNIMQKVNLLMGAFIALTVISCKKEVAGTRVQAYLDSKAIPVTEATSKIGLSTRLSNYGAYISVPDTAASSYDYTCNVASELNVSCIRQGVLVPQGRRIDLLSSSYNILLNFNSSGTMPMPFRTDLTTYKNDLTTILNSFTEMPLMAVIENEESNLKYFKGTAIEYVNQIKAAIPVMHAKGIKVANGGVTSSGLAYLVYQDYIARGMTAEAESYKKRMRISLKSVEVQDRASFIDYELTNFAIMDIDYVNFHWRSMSSSDAQALGETIDYLKRKTGKPVIINELSQYDTDPNTVTQTVQMCANYKLPFVLWYSNFTDPRTTELHNPNKSLTNTGYAYRDVITTDK